MSQIKVNSPADAEALPWAGNFADDEPLFQLVDEYIAREPDRAKRYAAERIASLAMGERLPEDMPPDFE